MKQTKKYYFPNTIVKKGVVKKCEEIDLFNFFGIETSSFKRQKRKNLNFSKNSKL